MQLTFLPLEQDKVWTGWQPAHLKGTLKYHGNEMNIVLVNQVSPYTTARCKFVSETILE